MLCIACYSSKCLEWHGSAADSHFLRTFPLLLSRFLTVHVTKQWVLQAHTSAMR